jgi:hypothetical protein
LPGLFQRRADHARAAINRHAVPGFADADAVDIAAGQRIGGKGRGNRDNLHIDIGIDTAAP